MVSFVKKTHLSDLLTVYMSHVAVTKSLKLKQAFGFLSEIQTHKTSLKYGDICQDIGHTMQLYLAWADCLVLTLKKKKKKVCPLFHILHAPWAEYKI